MGRVKSLLAAVLAEAILSFTAGLAASLGESLASRIAPPKRETSSGDETKEK